jgi:hypothetical protein
MRNQRQSATRLQWQSNLSFLLLLASPLAWAKPLEILGARVDLPFDYQVVDTTEHIQSSYGLSTSQVFEIQVNSGDAKGQTLVVDALYYSPSNLDAGAMQSFLRSEAEKAAVEPGVRSVLPIQIDGFGFNFVDGPIKSKKYPQRMAMAGVVNGAAYTLKIGASDVRAMSPQLAERMKAMHLDYASLLKARSRFDEEARQASKNHVLESPIGSLQLDSDVSARLVDSFVKRNATGNPVFRRRSFGLYKTGFWTIQNLLIAAGCGKQDTVDLDSYGKFVHMTEEQANEDVKKRYTDVVGPVPGTLLGLTAETSTATGPQINPMRHTGVHRWAAKQDDTMYMVSIERLNGSPVENALVKQFSADKPVCRLDLPFAPDVTPPFAPPPPPEPPRIVPAKAPATGG